jgi:hypothetical protein
MHVVDGFERALYFSSVTYSTVGYGSYWQKLVTA